MKVYYMEERSGCQYYKVTIEDYNNTTITFVDDEHLEGFEQCLKALGYIREY